MTSQKWLTVAIIRKWQDSIMDWNWSDTWLEIWYGLVWFGWYSLVWGGAIMACHGWLSWMTIMDGCHGWLSWIAAMDDCHGWLSWMTGLILHIDYRQTNRQTDRHWYMLSRYCDWKSWAFWGQISFWETPEHKENDCLKISKLHNMTEYIGWFPQWLWSPRYYQTSWH